jgi:hypothetical protein
MDYRPVSFPTRSLRRTRRTCRSVMPISSAACFCVISFFLATSRSRLGLGHQWLSTLRAGPCQ